MIGYVCLRQACVRAVQLLVFSVEQSINTHDLLDACTTLLSAVDTTGKDECTPLGADDIRIKCNHYDAD